MERANRKPSSEILLRLARNLTRLRKAQGYTQRDLAKRCGFTNTYVSNIEQATMNVTLATLEALTEGLDCHETDLFSRQGETKIVREDG